MCLPAGGGRCSSARRGITPPLPPRPHVAPVWGQSLCSNSLLFLRTLSLNLIFITSAKTLLLNKVTLPGDIA